MSEPSDKRRRTVYVLRLLSFIHKIKQSVPVFTGKIMAVFTVAEADVAFVEILDFKVVFVGINKALFAVKLPYFRSGNTA